MMMMFKFPLYILLQWKKLYFIKMKMLNNPLETITQFNCNLTEEKNILKNFPLYHHLLKEWWDLCIPKV